MEDCLLAGAACAPHLSVRPTLAGKWLTEGACVTVLIVPGLNDSGPGHWQSWFETQLPDTVRVIQPDWSLPNLDAWAANVAAAIDASPTPPLVVAHSFGVLATVRARPRAGKRIAAAMLVAPADPDVFGYARLMPRMPLPYPSVLVASQTDPWLSFGNAAIWAGHWALALHRLWQCRAHQCGFRPRPLAGRAQDLPRTGAGDAALAGAGWLNAGADFLPWRKAAPGRPIPGATACPAREGARRLSADTRRSCDQTIGGKVVDVPRQQGDPLDEVALLTGIEHAEEFGDRSAVLGRLEGRIGPDGGVGHGMGSGMRPRSRLVARPVW